MSRTTGSWIVKRTFRARATGQSVSYLIGGPFDPDSIRSWLAWGPEPDAYVFPTKTAARAAVRGISGCTVEASRS